MNSNEVLANLALEHLSLPQGKYDFIFQNDHINKYQSTNDVYPTALRFSHLLMVLQP
ncbi:aspartate ammonia-lyase [Acinetobacter johnsonii]|nr:aspartate ammonia-lyase [Acinetobacter johnsonii]